MTFEWCGGIIKMVDVVLLQKGICFIKRDFFKIKKAFGWWCGALLKCVSGIKFSNTF